MAATSSPETLPAPKSDNLCRLEEFDTLSKLRRGYKVTDIEKESLLTLASGAEAEARSVDMEIARLRALVPELEQTRDSLLKAASRARSLTAPIRKLPPEILVEIFFLTYSSVHFTDSWPNAGYEIPTVLAGNVCSLWQDIAISTPKLWSCITISIGQGLPRRALQRFKEVLELSGNVLLDLTVKTPMWITEPEQMPFSALFPVIQKHSQRWKHLTLYGHPYLVPQFLNNPHSFNSESSTLSLQLPSLYSLEINISADEEFVVPAPMALHIPSASAPNLRNVSIRRTYDHHGGLSFDLPWRQLDSLMFGVRSLSEFFNALSKSTSVTQVRLDAYSPDEERESRPLHPISSDTLTSLRFSLLDGATYDAMSICFDKPTLPHLRELHVVYEAADAEGYYHDPEWPIDSFRIFVNRSGFPITVLTIIGVPMMDSTLIHILECLPRLEALVAEESECVYLLEGDEEEHEYPFLCLTNRLMKRLQVRVQEPTGLRIIGNPVASVDASMSDPTRIQKAYPFLPSLREIILKGCGSQDTFSFKTFLKMVRTRRAAVMALPEGSISILKTVELHIWDQPVDEAVQEEVDHLRLCHEDLVLNVSSDKVRMDV
jgi:hypothetical protein